MSVRSDYCMWLGQDRRSEPLDESTRELARRIEEVDWAFENPRKSHVDGLTVYFWESVIGPYYRDVSKLSPIEAMIDEVKSEYPQLDNHYSLFVWVENQFSRVDGRFHEHNMFTWSTINVATEDPENCDVPRTEEMRARIRRSRGLPYDG